MDITTIFIILCMVIVMAFLFGSDAPPNNEVQPTLPQDQSPMPPLKSYQIGSESQNIETWHDDVYNVTCWGATGYSKGGFSCIPDSQLNRSVP
jgi:hypothetical protein